MPTPSITTTTRLWMRADNTDRLLAASRERAERAHARAVEALATITAPVTVARLAKLAGVSRSWIYTQPQLIEQIETLAATPPPPPRTVPRPSERAPRRCNGVSNSPTNACGSSPPRTSSSARSSPEPTAGCVNAPEPECRVSQRLRSAGHVPNPTASPARVLCAHVPHDPAPRR